MEARKILREIYLFNHKSKSIHDLEKKKKAFDYFDQFKTKPKRRLDDEILKNTSNSTRSNLKLSVYLKSSLLKVK